MSDAPYTEVNEAWLRYERRWWVLDLETGRVGMIDTRARVGGRWVYLVQFGSGGPFEDRRHEELLLATKTQVHVMEGTEPRKPPDRVTSDTT